jgi:hypothetical protein
MAHCLVMDVHVPKAITDGLRRTGIDVFTAQELGASTATDERLLELATELSCLLFSQDDDLLKIAAQWQAVGKDFPGVIYGHQLECSIGQTIEDLELISKCATQQELQSQVVFLPLSN